MQDVIITGKKYLRIKFRLASPLIIGCGKNDVTDNDILKDSRGIPYIPATAIAGVVRDRLYKYGVFAYKASDNDSDDNEDEYAKKIFGHVRISRKAEDEGEQSESRIIFYDGHIVPEDINNISISIRDSVALDKYKTAMDGAKFDMEILEPGVSFCTYVELSCTDEDDSKTDEVWKNIKGMFHDNALTFGAKTMRGMGEIETTEISEAKFNLTDVNGIKEWVGFKMYAGEEDVDNDKSEQVQQANNPVQDEDQDKESKIKSKWEPVNDAETISSDNSIKIDLELELKGGISIRRYSTDVAASEMKEGDNEDSKSSEKAKSEAGDKNNQDKAMPDYEQLTVKGVGGTDIPVIPGTSWAGAFRHRMEEFIDKDKVISLFGTVNEKEKKKKKSLISFSESTITGGSDKTISRTAIDRFTGGAAEGALYTEKTHYGGNTKLTIRIDNMDRLSEREQVLNALAAAILDLHFGYLAVGGLTSVGRGLFKVNKISVDGKDVISDINEGEAERIYELLAKAISGKAGGNNE